MLFCICGQFVALVPKLDNGGTVPFPIFLNPQFMQDRQHVRPLRFSRWMGDVADVDDIVSASDFFERRPKGGDQLCWQIGNETNRVGQNRLFHAGKFDLPHCRIERRE